VLAKEGTWSPAGLMAAAPALAYWWFLMTVVVVMGHVVFLAWKHDVRSSLIWFVKLITDPFTDIKAYYTSPFRLLANEQAEKHA
jgi:glutamate-1-semialdehyde 2,1-aminomutase